MLRFILLALVLLTSCQQTSSVVGQRDTGNVHYNESPVQPITAPLIVKYKPFYNASSVRAETTVEVDKSGKEKTSTERSEGMVSATTVGKNLLYQTNYKAGGSEFTMNILMTERGEILEITVSGADAAASDNVNQALKAIESTIKAYSIVYPSEGVRTGDDIFAGRGEVQMASFDARINLKGRVEGLVHSRGRPSILVDIAGSYLIFGSNPKAYMEGWMLLDVNAGIPTRMYTRAVMRFTANTNVEKIMMTTSNEIRLPPLTSNQNTDPSEKQFYLDVAWENVLEKREVFPVMIRQVGRVGYLKSASLIGGKKCDAVFRYDETGQGDWDVTCADGTRAVGVLQTLGTGKGSKGSGFDTNGNKIDFRILHDIPRT